MKPTPMFFSNDAIRHFPGILASIVTHAVNGTEACIITPILADAKIIVCTPHDYQALREPIIRRISMNWFEDLSSVHFIVISRQTETVYAHTVVCAPEAVAATIVDVQEKQTCKQTTPVS